LTCNKIAKPGYTGIIGNTDNVENICLGLSAIGDASCDDESNDDESNDDNE
jgi:hypothetical protein